MKWDMLESGNLRIKTVNWYKPNNKFMGKTKPYFQIITEGIRVYSACIRVGRSMGASMHCDIHLGDIQIDTPVYERWYMMLHFQSSKLTDAKTLNACKKCQLRLQILEQGRILHLDIVSVLLRNSRRQPFTGSHTFDLPEVFGIFRLSNAVQSLGTTRMSRALDIDMERSGISLGLPIWFKCLPNFFPFEPEY